MHDIIWSSEISSVGIKSGSSETTALLVIVIDKEVAITDASFLALWDTCWYNNTTAYSCST